MENGKNKQIRIALLINEQLFGVDELGNSE